MSAGGPSDQRVTSPEAIFKWLCSVEWVGTIFSRREFVPKSTGYQPHGSKRPFYHPALRQLSGVNGGWALAKQGECWRRVLSVAPNMGAGGSHPQATRACTWSQKRGELNSKVDIHDDFLHHVHIICQLVALQTSASLHQRQSLSDCAQWSGWVQSSLEGSCSKIYYYLDDDFERAYILYIRLMGSNSG